LARARAGETYIPIVPSATVMNIARALIDGRDIDVRVTGIRPGEKLHEILVSEEECHHSIRRGEYYVILPMLPELRIDHAEVTSVLPAEYSSADHALGPAEVRELLADHRLLIDKMSPPVFEELLR